MTSTERRPSWSERLQPRNWSLPVKLIAVVAVPTLLALALGGLRIADQSRTAATFDRVDRVVLIEQRVTGLIVRLQDERDQVVQFVAVRNRQDEATLKAAFDATDTARADEVRALSDESLLNSGTVGALRQVENQYFRLVQLRRQALIGANTAGDLVGQYSGVIAPLLVFDSALTRQLSDPQIGALSQAIGAIGDAREQVSAEKALISAVLVQKVLLPEQGDTIRTADSQLDASTSVVRSVLSTEQQARYTSFTGPVSTDREQLVQSVLTRGRANLPIDVAPELWAEKSNAVLTKMDADENGAREALRATSADQQSAAANLAGLNTVILLLGLLIAAAVITIVARALIRPLRTLRNTALDVAQRRLPDAVQSMRDGAIPDISVDPVPVTTAEEIGQVARAFDAVHSQAVRLAAEQATLQASVNSMFTNLSRRSQTLVERQLLLIDQLEANEQDPDQLSNLFQLDHLATRMRRNSENLLVLSGTDLAKRSSQPIPLVDVLRATVSEVEQYQRVVVQPPPQVDIVGRAATDLVHLLAELLDNATNFSAPDTRVVISSSQAPDGSLLIGIVDRGVGMTGDELADANGRLEKAGVLDVSSSRRMGLFVVGRLAARHGLDVRLGGSGPAVGMTASVVVPAPLLSSPLDHAGPNAQRPPGRGALPARELVPPQRASAAAGRPAPPPAPGPASFPPAPNGTPPANGVPREGVLRAPGESVNGTGPAEQPGSNGLPVRRPGTFVGKADSERPTDRPADAGRPQPPAPADVQPADQRRADPAPAGAAPADPAADQATAGHVPAGRPASDQAPASQAATSQAPVSQAATSQAPVSQAPTSQRPVTQAPVTQAPVTQAPVTQAPVTQGSVNQGPVNQTPAGHASPSQTTAGRTAAQQAPASQAPPGRSTGGQGSATAQAPKPANPPAADQPAREHRAPEPARGDTTAPPAAVPRGPAGQVPVEQPRDGREVRTPKPADPTPPTEALPVQGVLERPAPAPAQPDATRSPVIPEPAAAGAAPDSMENNLFAPAVPAISGPETLLSRSSGPESAQAGFELGETTPIFEEIASAWFRSNRLIPVSYDDPTESAAPPPPARVEAAQNGSGSPEPRQPARSVGPVPPAPLPVRPPTPEPAPPIPLVDRTPVTPVPTRPRPPAVPVDDEPAPVPVPVMQHRPEAAPVASSAVFATSADEGWRVSAVVAEPLADDLTAAGLPKRRPRARLVPGTAGTASLSTLTPTRTAEDVRGRLASYQQGVRQGREARGRRSAGTTPTGSFDTGEEETR